MKKLKIKNDSIYNKLKINAYKNRIKKKSKINIISIKYIKISQIILIINIIINIYLLKENRKNTNLINKILDFNSGGFKNNYPDDDKEMIGLYYPEINYDEIKNKLKNYNIIHSLVNFINQIEIKLIYLEKEINVVKQFSFYTSRKLFLKGNNIIYNEDNITESHEVVNWITIHKSNQLKGIASDKYLSCKYVKLKLGKNLCQQRIAVYNKLEELNYEELSKFGDIVLKISNSCGKATLLSHTMGKNKYQEKLNNFKKIYLKAEHGLDQAQFFHLYTKKRIIVEKQFIPKDDLYEFKFFILNKYIKFFYIKFYVLKKLNVLFYDDNYKFLYKDDKFKIAPFNLTSFFNKNTLDKLKEYAIKLSEDFPNFIRVDLYLFHNEIFFSELTFASFSGLYMNRDDKFIHDCMKNFSRVDNYY